MDTADRQLARLVERILSTGGGGPASLLAHGWRGAGKSWWMAEAARCAVARGMRVLTVDGALVDRDRPGAGLAALAAAGLASTATADSPPPTWRVAALDDLVGAAAAGPLCVVVDNVDLLDGDSLDALEFAMAHAVTEQLVLMVSGATAGAFRATMAAPIPAMSAALLGRLVSERGVHPRAAAECAAIADGNPGVAVAIANGLSPAQRAGHAPIPDLPRLAGSAAALMQARLRQLGEPLCRVLVVLAADDSGDLGAVRQALRRLSEPVGASLERAEELGLIEIADGRATFIDQWTRLVAYHLVAPASRRAAHRALAASYAEPHQARARVRHLLGASAGPDEAVAEAVALLAADILRRGGQGAAARHFERAAALSVDATARRARHVLALSAWADAGELERAAQLAATLDDHDDDLGQALADLDELTTGQPSPRPVDPDGGPAAARRHRRRSLWDAARAGDHRAVLSRVDVATPTAVELPAVLAALRHAGRVREARDLWTASGGRAPERRGALAAWTWCCGTDVELLSGREHAILGEADAAVSAAARAALTARQTLMSSPLAEPGEHLAAWDGDASGPLADIRGRVGAAVAVGDATQLERAVGAAVDAGLAVEAGEARMWLATVLANHRHPKADEVAQLAMATLQRCGVRGWDRRCAALVTVDAPVVVDPTLAHLSISERRVAQAVAEGGTNRQIAAALYLSVKTVDFHLQQIYRKLGIKSRTELAVRMAVSSTMGGRQ